MDTRYALGIVIAGLVVIGVIAAAGHSSNGLGTNASSTPTGTSSEPVTPTPATSPTTPVTPTPAGSTQSGSGTLALGQSSVVGGATLKPISIVEDSRCPVGVQCIQAGTVRVSMTVTANGGSTTQTFGLGKPLIARGERITLTSVTPAKSTTAAASADYRFTFSVAPAATTSPVPTPTPASPVATGGCYVGGCSGEICSDQPNAVSSCVYRPEYACYKTASCARQSSGQCGWTQTAALEQCIASNSTGPLLQTM